MSEPAFTVDRYGGVYSWAWEPRRSWWKRWLGIGRPTYPVSYIDDRLDAGLLSEMAEMQERFGVYIRSCETPEQWAVRRERELRSLAYAEVRHFAEEEPGFIITRWLAGPE
ncbi:MAG: hypothetical protein LC798_12830 [Chloroflexi bacterium]|nr:hypothetical protein [Chloroflexota bacterium]